MTGTWPITIWCLVLTGLGMAAGCKTGEIGRVGAEPRTAISYAATASYPGPSDAESPFELAAVVDTRAKEIEIANLGVNAVPASTIWINKTFVHRLPGIQPSSVATIKYVQFLEAGQGVRDLGGAGQQPRLIEIDTNDEGLLEVPGPAYR